MITLEEKVKEFINTIQEKALGQDVLKSLTPGQQVIKIVKDELVELLGVSVAKLSAMLQGKRKMKADELIIFSEYFNLKSDFFADVNYLQECN